MARLRKQRFARGEYFAAIPQEVIESDAYRALPPYAVAVLVALASEYRGNNNGNVSLTASRARELGISSAWKLTASFKLLRATGLVEITRHGKYQHGRGIAALFALTWRPLNPTDKAYPPILVERPASDAWAKWRKPSDWRRQEQEIRRRAKGSTGKWKGPTTIPHVRDSAVPDVRNDPSVIKNDQMVIDTQREVQKAVILQTPRSGAPLDLGLGTQITSDNEARSQGALRSNEPAPCTETAIQQ